MRGKYPMPVGRGTAVARSIVSGAVEEILDVHADSEYEHGDIATIVNYRGIVAVPMLKDGRPIGAIAMARSQAGPVSERQINLLQSFADQAVIAIENVRLFDEVQTRTAELQESLEYQTATSDVLNVISRSPSELQPVLDAIVATAARLCKADMAAILKCVADRCHVVATNGMAEEHVEYLSRNPLAIDCGSVSG